MLLSFDPVQKKPEPEPIILFPLITMLKLKNDQIGSDMAGKRWSHRSQRAGEPATGISIKPCLSKSNYLRDLYGESHTSYSCIVNAFFRGSNFSNFLKKPCLQYILYCVKNIVGNKRSGVQKRKKIKRDQVNM